MKRSAAIVASLLLTASVSASTLPELLQKAKDQFRLAAYTDALATLDLLDAASQKEGLEKDRAALAPVLAFYRGASLASLGRPAEAQGQFQAFLAFQPNAVLDPAVYSKKIIAALEGARRTLASNKERPARTGSVAMAYRAFPQPRHEEQVSLGEEWTDGPVRFLMANEDRHAFSRLSDPVSRSEYVTAFWKGRDPKPETPENEFRDEFEKRVAFADSRFTQGETAGSLTDRGMVFILLGPPTWVGQKPLTSGEDTNDKAALFTYRPADVRIASMPGGTTTDIARKVDKVTGPGTSLNEAAKNWREVWHYRREQLPKGIPYHQVDFQFVTKQGYGENVLQRETQVLDTLEKAKSRLRQASL
ncbi:MAG TPA: GWxTD domain-containing protein [Thermoanaerobaculia bacterium]|jgi:GWxTD domain-containing protein|nr:GWxTD domain-containing protein [Thermoanaerobaculia bacterium]